MGYSVFQATQTSGKPLKYILGDEKADSVVVYSSVVTLDGDSRRLGVWTILVDPGP